MTGVAVFTAYCRSVPSIFLNWGSPSYFTSNWAWLRVMVAVCGMAFAISASLAGPVPFTDTNTPALGLFSGMLAIWFFTYSSLVAGMLYNCGGPSVTGNSPGPTLT